MMIASRRRSTARINLAMSEFTHLHLHTEYSLLDGARDVHKFVDRVSDAEPQIPATAGKPSTPSRFAPGRSG